jgi:Zinc-binding dehydrogenase
VIGADKRATHPKAPIHAIAEKLIIGVEDLPAEVRAATGGKGADVVFDLVGGVMFGSAVNCLALRGRLVEISATGQREVSFNLADFYHNESRLFGVDTLKRDLTASARVLEALTPGFVAGDYRAAPIAETCGLGEVREAYRKVAAGATGRAQWRPPDGGLRTWIHPLGWVLVELAASRYCGRTANVSSAEARATPRVIVPPCSRCCRPRSIRPQPLSIAWRANTN